MLIIFYTEKLEDVSPELAPSSTEVLLVGIRCRLYCSFYRIRSSRKRIIVQLAECAQEEQNVLPLLCVARSIQKFRLALFLKKKKIKTMKCTSDAA
jgi:hypothetical protein